jgi:ABC-2 type transport system permease protein
MSATRRLSAGMRIIWTIAARDITDAIKNRTTLSMILMVLFTMLIYRILPSLQNADVLPRLALYDAGHSRLVAELDRSPEFDAYPMASLAGMEAYVADKDIVMLGLVLPTDFDQRLASDAALELDGYVAHWAGAGAAAEVQGFFEEQLTQLVSKPVRIDIAGHTVYTQKNSRGYAMLAALSVILTMTMVAASLVPNLILEEKQARTLDALLVSPASVGQVVLGKALAGLFYCLTGTTVAYALNLALINQWGVALLVAICGSLFAVALGLLLGSAIQSRAHLMLWAWILIIFLLAPVFLSIISDVLSTGLVTVLGWVPTVALSKALRVSFSDSAPLAQFGPELALVIGWTVPILIAVVWIVRRSDR